MPAGRGAKAIRSQVQHAAPNILAVLETYKAALEMAGRAEHTLYNYIRAVEQFAASCDNIPLEDVTEEHIQRYMIALRDAERSPNTLSSRWRALVTFLRWAESRSIIERVPTRGLKAPKVPETEPAGFAIDEVRPLLATCDQKSAWGPRDRAIILTLYGTGLRVGELVQLRRADVEEKGALSRYLSVMGKGSRQRTISLLPEVREAISFYLMRRGADGFPDLWIGKFGPFTKVGVQQMLRDRGKKAGLEHVHPHRFRNTALSEMLDAGMSTQEVMRIAGHRTEAMLRRYTGYSLERRANDAMLAANHVARLGLNERPKRKREPRSSS